MAESEAKKLNELNVWPAKEILFLIYQVSLESFCSVSSPGFTRLRERRNEGPHLEKSSAIKYDLTKSVEKVMSVRSSLETQTLTLDLMVAIRERAACKLSLWALKLSVEKRK